MRDHAIKYHLTTRLDLSRIASEIRTIERNVVQFLLHTDESLEADKKRRENARSIYIIRMHTKSIESVQCRFNDFTFKATVDRLTRSIVELESIVQETTQSPTIADETLKASELVRLRCDQLDQFHQIGFQDHSAEL